MAESRFWKTIAVLLVAGVFYVGHGMHLTSPIGMPPLLSQAKAGGIAMQRMGDGTTFAVTCSPDGKKVYYFGPRSFADAFSEEAYLGFLSVP